MVICETPEKSCWYQRGISAINIPLHLKSEIVAITLSPYKVRILTPPLLQFLKRCRAWARALRWSRGLRQLCKKELFGALTPAQSPLWRKYLTEDSLLASAQAQVAEPKCQHDRAIDMGTMGMRPGEKMYCSECGETFSRIVEG